MNCVCCTTKHGIHVDIAVSFSVNSQTSDASDWGVVNRVKQFNNITLIDDV